MEVYGISSVPTGGLREPLQVCGFVVPEATNKKFVFVQLQGCEVCKEFVKII